MADIYLDSNWVFDITGREIEKAQELEGCVVYISPLSCHILYYAAKLKVPNKELSEALSNFVVVDLTREILKNSLEGPTNDLEDNIQLHSCAEAEADYFLTNDKKLLKMKFFGKSKIVSNLKK